MAKKSKKKKNKLHFTSLKGSGRVSIADESKTSQNLGINVILNSSHLSVRRKKLLKYRQGLIDQINTSKGENILMFTSKRSDIVKRLSIYIHKNERLLNKLSADQKIRSGINTIGIKITSPKIEVYRSDKDPKERIASDFRKVGLNLAKASLKIITAEQE